MKSREGEGRAISRGETGKIPSRTQEEEVGRGEAEMKRRQGKIELLCEYSFDLKPRIWLSGIFTSVMGPTGSGKSRVWSAPLNEPSLAYVSIIGGVY
jgi:hypothetical protein